MFTLSSTPIDVPALRAAMADVRAGGFVAFEGWVRDFSDGRQVLRLEYEAFAPLAEKEGARILEETRRNFAVFDIRCAHRVGRLELGDLAVWVGVSAQHRGAAFDACRFVIDEVKSRVPIWKKEYYAGGDTGWVNAGSGAAAPR
jgi:molybdopterin synthase catalytic subunit